MLQFPENVRDFLARKYRSRREEWLEGGGAWPLEISLGHLKEGEAESHQDVVREWVSAWSGWSGPGELSWVQRRWRTLGTQRIPDKLAISSPSEVAVWIGVQPQWSRAAERYNHLIRRWPTLARRLSRSFDVLVEYDEHDVVLLERLLTWLIEHPSSNIYPRQIPLPGMDTKWLQLRMPLISGLLECLQGKEFTSNCGLKPLPHLVRLRILDPALRSCVGPLRDIAAPVDDLAALQLPISRVYIVENLQTGLSFEDRPSTVVFMGLGRGACALAQVPWVSLARDDPGDGLLFLRPLGISRAQWLRATSFDSNI